MNDKLILYTNPMSRGRIARWMLEEVGKEYETKLVNYGPDMKAPEYLKLNPMGKVPALAHGNRIVTECAAICAYLADTFPDAKLSPSPEERAFYYRWLFFASGPLEAAISNKSFGFEVPQEKEGVIGYGNFDLTVKTLAQAVSNTAFISGPRFTAADVYVGSQVGWGLQFGSLPKIPEFEDYWNRLNKRKAYLRAT